MSLSQGGVLFERFHCKCYPSPHGCSLVTEFLGVVLISTFRNCIPHDLIFFCNASYWYQLSLLLVIQQCYSNSLFPFTIPLSLSIDSKMLLVFHSRRDRSKWCNILQAQNPSLLSPILVPLKTPVSVDHTDSRKTRTIETYTITT